MDKYDLRQAVTHLAFDVYHFRCYALLIRENRLSACPRVVSQAIRYSLLLHLRVLLGFFSGPPQKDDCWVGHFTEFPEVRAAYDLGNLTPTQRAKELGVQLNKRLAHFTVTRWAEKAPSMDFYQEYFNEIERLIEAFQRALPQAVQQDFASALSEWERKHPRF